MLTTHLTVTPVSPIPSNDWPRIYVKRGAPYLMYLVARQCENTCGETYLSMMTLHGGPFWTQILMPESKIDQEYDRLPPNNEVTLTFRT